MSLKIEVIRDPRSQFFKINPYKLSSWENNRANNSIDDFLLYDNGVIIFRSKCQSIANCDGIELTWKYTDTLAPGPFLLKAFVEPRNFYGRIHGICNAMTLNGDLIGLRSVTTSNSDRWLVHDWQKHKPDNPAGQDTSIAWSAGCIVLPTAKLAELGTILDGYQIEPGDEIQGILIERNS